MSLQQLNERRICGLALLIGLLISTSVEAGKPCTIQVIDESNGWPVPLVELTTIMCDSFLTTQV